MRRLARCWILVTLTACGYDARLGDCVVRCAADEAACPDGMSCGSEQLCRTGETPAACASLGGDAGPCLAYFDDEVAFVAATSTSSLVVEDFSRIADGSPTPNAFVVQSGDYFFRRDRVTFTTRGVNTTPGEQPSTIAVGGSADPASSSIMPHISGTTARDALEAAFASSVAAVALRPSDDDGAQAYVIEVVTPSGTTTFPVAPTHAPFVGVASSCGAVITAVALVPPTPSHWWRLLSVTFGP